MTDKEQRIKLVKEGLENSVYKKVHKMEIKEKDVENSTSKLADILVDYNTKSNITDLGATTKFSVLDEEEFELEVDEDKILKEYNQHLHEPKIVKEEAKPQLILEEKQVEGLEPDKLVEPGLEQKESAEEEVQLEKTFDSLEKLMQEVNDQEKQQKNNFSLDDIESAGFTTQLLEEKNNLHENFLKEIKPKEQEVKLEPTLESTPQTELEISEPKFKEFPTTDNLEEDIENVENEEIKRRKAKGKKKNKKQKNKSSGNKKTKIIDIILFLVLIMILLLLIKIMFL